MSDEILLTADAGIATIQINRPHKKNALTGAMYETMTRALQDFDRDDAVRAVVLRGAADFTAGNDLNDFIGTHIENLSASPPLRYLFALHAFAKPVVAAVSGVAIGIGTTMLLHADIVLAGRAATFALPFVKISLVPEAAATLLLPRAAGLLRAKHYLMTGETFGAETARELGIVAQILPDAELYERAHAQAAAFAALPAAALMETKRLLGASLREQIVQTMTAEAEAFAVCLRSEEFRSAAAGRLASGRGPQDMP